MQSGLHVSVSRLPDFQLAGGIGHPPARPHPGKLDGAYSALMHLLGEVNLEDVEEATKRTHTGMRLGAVWREEREGGIQDIAYFRPAA